ncbi:MAG: type II toxin-antitoxin system VapC family toxin [Chloroflexi bacterium]|nr:type II toxin-antitoxin system VapC family toxin [Chloroflexota bacterium]
MKYLLDSNVCIRYLKGQSEKIRQMIHDIADDEIALCSVVKGELFYGAARSNQPEKSRAVQDEFVAHYRSLPFDDAAAEHYAQIRAKLYSKGTPISPNDLLIAAIGLANNLTLVTHNVVELSRVDGLKIEDWEQ